MKTIQDLTDKVVGEDKTKATVEVVVLLFFLLIIIFLFTQISGLADPNPSASYSAEESSPSQPKPYISYQDESHEEDTEKNESDTAQKELISKEEDTISTQNNSTENKDILGESSTLSQIGDSCSANNQCQSGHCVDGVCCDSACTGTCQRCDSFDGTAGTCHLIANNHDPDNECTATWSSCDSECRRTGGDGSCSGTAAACDSNDRSANIASGYVCTGNGIQTPVSQMHYCNYDENCVAGACSASQWWTSCNGSGSCRSEADHTDSYTKVIFANENASLTATCQQSGTTMCDTTWEYALQPGDNYYGIEAGLRKYYCQGACDGSGTCDYASNCTLHYTVLGLETETFSAVSAEDWETDLSQNPQIGNTSVGIKDDHGQRIAQFAVNFDQDLNWSSMSAESRGTKSYFHMPGGFSNIDGAIGDGFSLYVFKGEANKVGICPNADSLAQVDEVCEGIYYLDETAPNVQIVTEAGITYWKIDGLTGTGGFSLSSLKDTLTREQVNTASDHDIEFITTYSIDSNGDTITVQFDPASQGWNLGSITVGDIDLEDDSADKTLAGSAGAGTWGVSINTTTDTITFTAPTDAGPTEIVGGSSVHIKIGTNADGGSNQIVNPATAGQYEVSVHLDNGTDEDFGELEIPIVDDDTVNITSFLDTFIMFDIDTSHIDEDCDAAGGTSPCDSHSGATDDAGYVVDLGELSSLSLSKSGDNVMHADGSNGSINYIYFNVSTNSNSGAIATIISANGALNGPGINAIPTVTNDGDGVTINAGDGAYGIREVGNSTGSGSFTISGDYNGGAGVYGEATTTATQIFSTGGLPLNDGRLWMEVGVSPDTNDGTGTYTDTLTFIVTSTF